MTLVRRRYYIWLVRAYIKRWSKTILTSLSVGIGIFFIFVFAINFYFLPLVQKKVQKIGYTGTYTTGNLPNTVLSDVSYGLTQVMPDGSVKPAAAYKWDIKNSGKTYTFYIRKGQYFNDNHELTASNINYSFKDAKVRAVDDYTLEVTLKEPYSPFLSTVARPILSTNFSGLGDYKLTKIDLNGGFVKSIALQKKSQSEYRKIIYFYPTQDALKMAYALGEVDKISGVFDLNVDNSNFNDWANTIVEKNTNYHELLTVFYNNTDSYLSDKKLRQALNYALPEKFSEGERAYSPIPPNSIYFSKGPNYGISDPAISKSLLDGNDDVKKQVFEISTPEEFEKDALAVAAAWEKIGIKSKVKVVQGVPSKFQIFVYLIKLPSDPDQYTLWHSNGANNILNYRKNQRIDKLLEDGRSITDTDQRISIYADFQKYLLDDSPASFLYFPYSYTLTRR